MDSSDFADFTMAAYRAMLRALSAGNYAFAGFRQQPAGRHVIIRHDIDHSLHRAAKMAALEAEEGVKTTYFLLPRSRFYSLTEPECFDLVQSITEHGHEIGLHLDTGTAQWTAVGLAGAAARECSLLELLTAQPVRSVAYHNPDMSNALDFADETIAGLPNAYAARLKRDYVYSSDSNGYWRHAPMPGVIAQGHERLYLLTHPEWWSDKPKSPSARIDDCIYGRARAARTYYDGVLSAAGRQNIIDIPDDAGCEVGDPRAYG